MAKIKHIAMSVPDPEASADFYCEAFDMKKCGTTDSPLAKGCRCDIAHIRDVIGRFPAEERVEMAGSDGIIGVDCAFCSRIFPLALDSFTAH